MMIRELYLCLVFEGFKTKTQKKEKKTQPKAQASGRGLGQSGSSDRLYLQSVAQFA